MNASSSPKTNQIIEVTIDRLSFGGGRGVGRYNELVVFVPFTLPGETVKAKILKVKKTYAECELLSVLSPSKHRTEAPCKHFQVCGGCTWQHIDYAYQVELKTSLLIALFGRALKFNGPIESVTPSAMPFNYRNRIQVQKGKNRLGYHRRKSKDIVEISECKIAETPLNNFLASDESKNVDGRVELFLDSDLMVRKRVKSHQFDAPYFSQVNRWQNDELKNILAGWLKQVLPTKIYDLYCGNGNLTRVAAENHMNILVEAVDFSTLAISEAKSSLQSFNIKFIESDVTKYLKNLKEMPKGTLLILDPPRVGLDQSAAEKLYELKPDYIIYVSCDPSTLTRDLKILLKYNDYKIDMVKGLDMFPQTDHLEVMTFVSRL